MFNLPGAHEQLGSASHGYNCGGTDAGKGNVDEAIGPATHTRDNKNRHSFLNS
jgi:hypothetical protein